MRRTSLSSWILGVVLSSVWACGGGEKSGTGSEGEGGAVSGEGGGASETGGESAARSSSSNAGGSSSETTTGSTTTDGGTDSGGTTAAGGTTATAADKLDLLLVIDNSLSMADKQAVMAAAVPLWLTRLTNPDCISADGATRVSMTANLPTDSCVSGANSRRSPLANIHIGVISSSLGDFGGDTCPETATESSVAGFPDQNDHGWLLSSLGRADTTTATTERFLSWTAANANNYVSAIAAKTDEFRNFVTGAGELGCGFEMVLESWYRFLVDPNPPLDVIRNGNLPTERSGTDGTILEQRAAFLRSDSVVAVVMVSDENDCSFKDSGAYTWWATTAMSGTTGNRMYRPSAACSTAGPNDRCCYSCMLGGIDTTIPADCIAADPTCVQTSNEYLTSAEDQTNLRCWQQKRRFGYDFLFPVARYANALSKKTLCPERDDLDCALGGTPVANPLYEDLSAETPTGPDRDDPSRVFFAGIVGVPWQDLATANTLADGTVLEYKTASQLDWDLFAPVDEYATAPGDPLMIESIVPRAGTHPITNDALVGSDGGYLANPINGHEWSPQSNSDLQYACIFSLDEQISDAAATATRNCVQEEQCPATLDAATLRECQRRFQGCACAYNFDTAMSPLCQMADGSYSTTQVAAKAYPGLRELQALRAFYTETGSDNAVVASICPKDLTYANRAGAGYGYNPAFIALVNRMSAYLLQP